MLAWSNLQIPNLFLCISIVFVNFSGILLLLLPMYFIVFMIFYFLSFDLD